MRLQRISRKYLHWILCFSNLVSYKDLVILAISKPKDLIDWILNKGNRKALHLLFELLSHGSEIRLRKVLQNKNIRSILDIDTNPRSKDRLYVDLLSGFMKSKDKIWKQDMQVFMYYLYKRGATFIPGSYLISKGVNEGSIDVDIFFGYEDDAKFELRSKGIKVFKRHHIRTVRADHKPGTIGYLVIMEPKLYKQVGGT